MRLTFLLHFLVQIMKVDHWQHIALLIRAQIDISEGKFDDDEPDKLEDSEDSSSSSQEFRNIVLGAKQKPLSFSAIESTHSEDSAFKKFRERFCKFLSIVLPEKTMVAYKSIFTQDLLVSLKNFTLGTWANTVATDFGVQIPQSHL